MIRYDPRVQQFLLRCARCLTWHTFIFQTRGVDLCERCLKVEERKAA